MKNGFGPKALSRKWVLIFPALSNSLFVTCRIILATLSSLGGYEVTITRGVVDKTFTIFEVFEDVSPTF